MFNVVILSGLKLQIFEVVHLEVPLVKLLYLKVSFILFAMVQNQKFYKNPLGTPIVAPPIFNIFYFLIPTQ